ncbi:MAG: hypothetical protein Unbinned1473contig1002_4 [Prokaryotic dsDNA virus sp.]|nr:MAG: hypothetical protein Unbinned1473contig1002_4 [Prokaryotic dsDNA virus sp.]|tara:strand:+ start:11727 stop:12173 length:447 start_codon:yes stop_codon:yes gene_type:complete
MNKLCCILLLMLSSCYSSEEHLEEIEFIKTNLDSLFLAADGAVEQVANNKKEKTLLEQDLWRKKRDIKNIEQKYTDSIWSLSNMYELQTLKVDTDSTMYNYKIVLREIVDTVRLTVTDSVCSVCLTKQNKKDNRFYKKAFRWIQKIQL